MKLSLTEAALDDLRSIRTYTLKTWGEELFPGCRIAAEGRYVILFHSTNVTITVVRFLHSAMDFKRPRLAD